MARDRVVYALSLSPDLHARAVEAADRLGEGLAVWIRIAIREKLERDGRDSAAT
jgi:predicted HicB family RNase H-like nuclease